MMRLAQKLGVWRLLFPAIAGLNTAACLSIETQDRRPGGKVITESKAVSWFSGPTGVPAGTRVWTYVKVVAPPGSTKCHTDKPFLESTNPFAEASVDAEGAAMITVLRDAQEVKVTCATPTGDIKRTVASERHVFELRDRMGAVDVSHIYWIPPPLLHIVPSDPQADARWGKLKEEMCGMGKPVDPQLCDDERLARMRSRDLAATD